MVGTSIASYDLHHGAVAVRCRAPALRTLTPLHDSPCDLPNVTLSLDCPKNVPRTRCLAVLKWWLEPASPPTTRCTHHGAVAIRRRAPALSEPPQRNDSTRLFESDSELRLSQERAKYAMLGGSEVVVGTSIASYDLMHARIVLWRSAAAPPPPPNPHTSQ